jgi:hypothetical protein
MERMIWIELPNTLAAMRCMGGTPSDVIITGRRISESFDHSARLRMDAMIRITITAEAFETIVTTLPLGGMA